jgi:hypothetical protein
VVHLHGALFWNRIGLLAWFFPRVSSLSQCHLNLVDNAINIIHHIIIPKADHLITLRFQIPGSLNIVFGSFEILRPKGVHPVQLPVFF